MAMAIPLAISIGSKIAGHYAAKRSAKAAQQRAEQRNPEELAAMQGATGAAGQLGQQGSKLFEQGQGLFNQGAPGLQKASSYYGTLLGGDRAAQQQATAAPRAAIGDIYRGADRGLERGGLRGASRETAQGELQRERAGRLAALTTGVQPMAAEALANISGQMLSLGGQTAESGARVTGAGGSLYSNLLSQGQQNRQQAVQAGTAAGNATASAIGGIGAAAGDAYGAWSAGRAGASGGLPPGNTGYGRPLPAESAPSLQNPWMTAATRNVPAAQQTYRPQGYAGYPFY